MYKHQYPKVNFIGNKEKLTPWICEHIPDNVHSILDAFCGGASVSYALKALGYTIYSNDILKANSLIAKALVENREEYLSEDDIQHIFSGKPYSGFMTQHYSNKLFYRDECQQLDLFRDNIEILENDQKKALAYSLMRRAMIRKMPYSRFNIKWDKVEQLRDEEYSYEKYGRRRAYHNQNFEFHFRDNLEDYNNAVFDNGKENKVYNKDIFKLLEDPSIKADLIYLDPPYAGTMNNYFDFYSPLDAYINQVLPQPFDNTFIKKDEIIPLFHQLFSKLQNFKYCMLSYNNNAYPDMDTMLEIMNLYAKSVEVITRKHNYQITGSDMKDKNTEYLFVMTLV